MMNRYSVPMNSNPDERLFFFYWEDMIEYLRNEMEADGHTFRYNITNWKECGKGKKASCQLTWVRINQQTMMAETVSRTVTCEDNTILPGDKRVDYKGRTWVDWERAQW